MRRSTLTTMIVIALMATIWTADAWARAGGGISGGSRGGRSYSAPARPTPSPTSPSRPASPPSSFQQPTPQRSPWGGLLGGLGGLMLGGLIGSLLFGGVGGGIGLLEILLIAGLAYFAFSYMRRRAPQPAVPAGYAPAGGADWKPEPVSLATATAELPPATADLDRGLDHIRQMDAAFDGPGFTETASDIFFRLQAAWMGRDLGPVRERLTDEMQALLERDCARLRAEGRVNRLENIAVRSAEVTEAWQEGGQDFVTVCFRASLLDYTTDESGTRVLEGSRTEPVKFEEYWTFVRPVGPNPWRLSAIHQPA